MPTLTTVYFDGSISITDANTAWTNDANAFNGNTTTFATAGGTQSPTSGALVGAGTSGSIGSGSTILSVRARLYGGGLTTRTWGPWVTLTAPTGGWTSANIKSLEARIYSDLTPSWATRVKARITTAGNAENLGTVEAGTDSDNTPDGANVGRVEIEVSTDTGHRYLRASGNWNGPVWADTESGTAGSASTPTANDAVYIAANYTVTLTTNAVAGSVSHINGTLDLASYKLTVGMPTVPGSYIPDFISTGSTARTINLGSGHLELLGHDPSMGCFPTVFSLSGSNLTFNAGTSLITINQNGSTVGSALSSSAFGTSGKVFNDVRINLKDSGTDVVFNITGSPTFRSLIIQSKNSAAHTVNFEDYSDIRINQKFIGIGSSTSNRLLFRQPGDFSNVFFTFSPEATSYGQNLDLGSGFYPDDLGLGGGPYYIGSTSVGGHVRWIKQNPPKISTLVDPLTTAPGSNPNWTVSGTVTQVTSGHDGGGYKFDNSDSIISSDTYDMVDSEIVIEIPPTPTGAGRIGINVGWEYDPPTTGGYGSAIHNGVFATAYIEDWAEVISTEVPEFDANGDDTGISSDQEVATLPTSIPYYIKFYADSSTNRLHVRYSSDGINYSNANYYAQLTDVQMLYLRTARISVGANMSGSVYATIGSINPVLPVPSNSNFLAFFYP